MSFVQLILMTSFTLIVTSHVPEKRHIDFQERFMERRREREIKDQGLIKMENEELNDIEIVNDVPHYLKKGCKSSKKWHRIETFERDFRRLLAMDGMKYTYKRDFYWRTWRRVASHGGTERTVCYKCNNIVQVPGLQNCGMWTIEEKAPPCPYEFFSVITDKRLCGAYYTQYTDTRTSCPSIINFSDLTSTCDNPIETKWRFTKMYGVAEDSKNKNIICDDQDSCEIITSYEMTPNYVIFRIINSTNDVIYSRIMKPNHMNYICIDDCGRFNQNTKKIGKIDIPLKLNLLTTHNSEEKIPEHRKNIQINELKHQNDTLSVAVPLTTKTHITEAVFSNFPPFEVHKVSKPVTAKVINKIPILLERRYKPKVKKRQPNNLDLHEYIRKHIFPKIKLYRWHQLNDDDEDSDYKTLDSVEDGDFNATERNYIISRWQRVGGTVASAEYIQHRVDN